MLKRSGRSEPISLFAFQDIIMGVTGVMLILVLALIAHWRSAPPPEQAPDPSAREEEKRAARLAAEERELVRALDELRKRIRADGAEKARRERIEALEAARKRLEEQEKKLGMELAALPEAPPEAPPDDAFARVRKLQAELRAWERKYLEKRYHPEPQARHDGRSVIFLECRDRDFLLTLPGEQPRRLGSGASLPLPAARRELFAALRELSPERHYLAVAVRPGAGAYIAMLLASLREDFPALPVSVEPMIVAADDGSEAMAGMK